MLKEMLYITSLCLIIVTTWLYVKMRQNLDYWRNREVDGPQPHILFGNFRKCYMKKQSYAELLRELYLDYSHLPAFGCFNMMIPLLIINDPLYIEKILKTDFSFFSDRTSSHYSRRHEFYKNLFNLNGPQWKAIRNKMAPIFTSLKIKSMTPQMEICFENTRNYIHENISGKIDMNEVASVFSHDVIVQCLFGLESKELSRPGTRFRRMQTEFFNMTIPKLICFTFIDQFPRVADFFNLTHFSKKTVQYFQRLVENALKQRSDNKDHRNDLINILLKMREKRILSLHGWEQEDHKTVQELPHNQTLEVTDELLESQAMIFFLTGIESLVSSLVFAVYELTRNPRVLAKLRNEVDQVTRIHGLSPKALNNMTYLDMCIKETLRLYPVVPVVNRLCSKRYELPCGLILEKGESLVIPVVGLHVDERYFPEPFVFKPERFSEEPPPFTYLPFGEGPRICFAMKFVTTELKVGLCKILQEFDFESVFEVNKEVKSSSEMAESFQASEVAVGFDKTASKPNLTTLAPNELSLSNLDSFSKEKCKKPNDDLSFVKNKQLQNDFYQGSNKALDVDSQNNSSTKETSLNVGENQITAQSRCGLQMTTERNIELAKWSMFMKPSSPVWIRFSLRQF